VAQDAEIEARVVSYDRLAREALTNQWPDLGKRRTVGGHLGFDAVDHDVEAVILVAGRLNKDALQRDHPLAGDVGEPESAGAGTRCCRSLEVERDPLALRFVEPELART
jgi:hypothetical protein